MADSPFRPSSLFALFFEEGGMIGASARCRRPRKFNVIRRINDRRRRPSRSFSPHRCPPLLLRRTMRTVTCLPTNLAATEATTKLGDGFPGDNAAKDGIVARALVESARARCCRFGGGTQSGPERNLCG
jgi:hypothetical protein